MPDFEVMTQAERKELEELRKIYRQACKVWASYMTHDKLHEIAVRDLCEMVDGYKMVESKRDN